MMFVDMMNAPEPITSNESSTHIHLCDDFPCWFSFEDNTSFEFVFTANALPRVMPFSKSFRTSSFIVIRLCCDVLDM